jgi:hypothetical protein
MQYRLLFNDASYIFMLVSCSMIYGILGAFGGSIVQEVIIWDMKENFGSLLAPICVIVGLLASIVVSVTLLKFKHQFLLFVSFQILSAIGLAVSYLGLVVKNIPVILIGTLAYAIFTFPSFPIMIELIGKRVGKSFQLVAAGNVYILTHIVTAAVSTVVGHLLNGKDKMMSSYSYLLIGGLLIVNGVLGLIASNTSKKPFNTDKIIRVVNTAGRHSEQD